MSPTEIHLGMDGTGTNGLGGIRASAPPESLTSCHRRYLPPGFSL